jgi:hypothetical protein
MKASSTIKLHLIILALELCCQLSTAQNSILVNFGGNACNTSSQPWFSMIKNPLTVSPVLLANCNLAAQTASIYSVFIAYNPANNKVYVADVRDGIQTKIWVLDIGLPFNISCPVTIPVTPTYSYSYVSNNFEFDNNGDLWSFSNYNPGTGQCSLDKFDVNTGVVINTRILQFPAGNFPNTIASGDLTILPNGRMFACLGNGISKLYEINNYSGNTTATATFLQTLPKDCYGIAYLNGMLELAGADFNNACYYYDYNIATNVLGTEKAFQNGQLPIDNTSVTPSVGCTKRLLSSTKINSNTADLIYEVYAENLGNVLLNNIGLSDDLSVPFGGANVSNVSAGFVTGSNAARLTINPLYNGTTNTTLLTSGQNLPNRTLINRDYFFKIQISCRVTNLNSFTTYLNAAIAKADIGSGDINSLVNVADSSNNGDSTVTDPNKNGNAGNIGENIPTPFLFGTLPVKFIDIKASLINKKTALLQWQIATPVINAANFNVEFSYDTKTWINIGSIAITEAGRGLYNFMQNNIPTGSLYYRIRQIDKDGTFSYSKIVLLNNKTTAGSFIVYPNPASNVIQISAQISTTAIAELFDAVGRRLIQKNISTTISEISTTNIPSGTYLLRITANDAIQSEKIVVKH